MASPLLRVRGVFLCGRGANAPCAAAAAPLLQSPAGVQALFAGLAACGPQATRDRAPINRSGGVIIFRPREEQVPKSFSHCKVYVEA